MYWTNYKITKDCYVPFAERQNWYTHGKTNGEIAARVMAQLLGTAQQRQVTKAVWKYEFHREREIEYKTNWHNSWEGKRFWSTTSICPKCSREISNRAYWGTTKNGSTHFRGSCQPASFYPEKTPRQTWKSKLVVPPPKKGWEPDIRTLEELCLYWGVNNVGGTITLPEKKAA